MQEAIRRGLERWGTHNGSSRAFASVRSNIEAEEKLADWLGVESTLIYPFGDAGQPGGDPRPGRPQGRDRDGRAGPQLDAGGRQDRPGRRNPGGDLRAQQPGGPGADAREAPPLPAGPGLHRRRLQHERRDPADGRTQRRWPAQHDAVLYIDDAHGTGVLGEQGRGTVLDALGSYDNTFVVGSLSKAFSCAGGFIGCTAAVPAAAQDALEPLHLRRAGRARLPRGDRARSSTSSESPGIRRAPRPARRAHRPARRGLAELGLVVMGGATPIVSVLVGDEADTLKAGKFLFDRGYYVQSVLFPAVPYHGGVLRVQCNANHTEAAIDGLIDAFAALKQGSACP